MKNREMFAALVEVVLSVCFTFPVATATVDSDACASGDHVWLLEDTDYGWYGGRDEFYVESCGDVAYRHKHYYITGKVTYSYTCQYCEATMTETTTYRDYDMGPLCTVYDPGK